MSGNPNPIEATVRLVRKDIVVEERAVFPDTGNINVLLQRLGADANRQFKPQLIISKQREELSLREARAQRDLMSQDEQHIPVVDSSANFVPSAPPMLAVSSSVTVHDPIPLPTVHASPPSMHNAYSSDSQTAIFQHVNAQLDRLAFSLQQMNHRLHVIEQERVQLEHIVVDGAPPSTAPGSVWS